MKTDGPFPRLLLRDLDGVPRPVAEAWVEGEALVLIGHRDCKTTRQTIPYVDRIHRRRGPGRTVLVILQDDEPTARSLAADMGLEVPLRLEEDPYPLAREVGLATVPTLFLVGRDGAIARTTEAFNRADLEEYAARFGVGTPLFTPEDKAPAFKPG